MSSSRYCYQLAFILQYTERCCLRACLAELSE
uniref:Uncharacterized protein n=1 Tax=Arundo donax TaxID=35708 RepID=A0A0A9FMD5_ARUDO